MLNQSHSLDNLKKIFATQNLVDKSDDFLDGVESKVRALFPSLSVDEKNTLHEWLNTGNTISNKINNFLTLNSWLCGPNGCNLSSLIRDELSDIGVGFTGACSHTGQRDRCAKQSS